MSLGPFHLKMKRGWVDQKIAMCRGGGGLCVSRAILSSGGIENVGMRVSAYSGILLFCSWHELLSMQVTCRTNGKDKYAIFAYIIAKETELGLSDGEQYAEHFGVGFGAINHNSLCNWLSFSW